MSVRTDCLASLFKWFFMMILTLTSLRWDMILIAYILVEFGCDKGPWVQRLRKLYEMAIEDNHSCTRLT